MIDPAAILALISNLWVQLTALQQENEALRKALDEKSRTPDPHS